VFSTQGSFTIDVPLEAVWALRTDVGSWALWDDEIVSASLDGPFATGSTGRIKYRRFPEGTLTMRVVEPQRRYAAEISLPGVTMNQDHRLSHSEAGTTLVEEITIDGTLASILGRRIKKTLPKTIDRFQELAAGMTNERMLRKRGL